MTTKSKRMRQMTGLVAGLGVLCSGVAVADANGTVVSIATAEKLIYKDVGGTIRRNTGSGAEDASIAELGGNKLLMCARVSTPNNKTEGFCGVAQLNASGPPTMAADFHQVTTYNKNRGFMKSTIAAKPGANWGLVGYASTIDNPNNPQLYVRVMDDKATFLTQRLRVNDTDNNNGAAWLKHMGTHTASGGELFLISNNNNGDTQDLYGISVATGGATPTPKVEWKATLFDSNIGRAMCELTGTDVATCCTAVGRNRPPEVGVGCANVNTQTGQVIKRAIVARSKPGRNGKGLYANQPSLVNLGNGKVALQVIYSNGMGRDGNKRVAGGTNVSALMTLEASTLTILDKTDASATSVAPTARHAHMLSGTFGSAGKKYIGAIGCSSSASGGAAMQMVHVDDAGKISFDPQNGVLPLANNCDSAYWVRMGKNNPNNQGRSFINAVSDVVNPGYGNPQGWMPEVKSFAAIPIPHFAADQVTNKDVRNSLHLSLVPQTWDSTVTISMSGVVDADSIKPGPSPTVNGTDPGNTGGGGTGGTDPTGGTGGGTPTTDPNHPYGPHSGANAQGCSVGSAGGAGGAVGGFALIGLAIALGAVRRGRKA